MKILHVITSLLTGGAEHLLVDLLPRLRSFGHEVELCVFNGQRTPFFDEIEKAGIKIHVLSHTSDYYNPKHILRLRKLMKGLDIVHTHNTSPQLFAALAKYKGTKLVTTEHNTDNRRRSIKVLKWGDKWMYSKYDRIICISDQAETNLRAYLSDSSPKISTLYNGIDVSRYLNATPIDEWKSQFRGKKIVVMVAAFRAQKDHKTLIDSFQYLPQDYVLLLVGAGEIYNEVKDYADQKNYADRVCFMGNRTDITNVLKTADVVVLSTHYEGLSLSNIEGMASGKPFVASDVEGIHEVTNGYGILFSHGDARALADAIERVTMDEQYRKSVIDKCVERALQYDIRVMAEQYNEVYLSLYGRSPK